MKTAKKNQYCEIHNSIRATLNLSCKMKSKQQSNKESQPAESPVYYQTGSLHTWGSSQGNIFFLIAL